MTVFSTFQILPHQIERLVLQAEEEVQNQAGEVEVGVQHQVGEEGVVDLLREAVEEELGAPHQTLLEEVEVEEEAE